MLNKIIDITLILVVFIVLGITFNTVVKGSKTASNGIAKEVLRLHMVNNN